MSREVNMPRERHGMRRKGRVLLAVLGLAAAGWGVGSTAAEAG